MNLPVLRRAARDDLPLLRYWDSQPHVIASDPDDDWAWETELCRDPSWREQLIAEINGKPVGFVQIIDPAEEESHYWGEVETGLRALDIWIGEEKNLRQGFGTKIMQLVLSRCFSSPEVDAVIIDPLESNKAARRFYRRIGFRFVEYRWFGNDYCAVYQLPREVFEENTD